MFFSYSLMAGMFYTWGVSGCPTFVHTSYICTPPYVCMPPGGVHAHMPPYSFMPLCVFGCFVCCGGVVMGSLCVGTPFLTSPLFGVPPPFYTPILSHWFPVHWYVSGISVCYVGISLLSGRVWGCFPINWGVGVSALEMSICSFLYFFCSALCLTFLLWF